MPRGKQTFSGAFGGSQGGASAKKKPKYSGRKMLSKKKKFILGTTTRATLRYAETITVTGSAVQGALGTYIFSANGCYDPNYTGVGTQPRGFDELMSLYDHYTVVGSTITARFANQSATRPYVGIAVRDSISSVAEVTDLAEYGDKVLSGKALARAGGAEPGEASTMLSTKCNVAEFLGRRSAMSDPELKGTANANPSEQVFYHICAGDVSASSAVNVDVIVTITYDVILHEPKIPTSS